MVEFDYRQERFEDVLHHQWSWVPQRLLCSAPGCGVRREHPLIG